VGLALFGMARTLEQGQSKPAAEALDGILTQLLRGALDFLARTFGLDKLPKLLRVGLQALRRPVEKGVNWVLDKIIKLAQKAWQAVKKGGAALAQAGQQAVGAVKGWLGIHEEFRTVNGETHELYFRNGELVRASTAPQEITKFLNGLLAKAQADGDTKQEGKIIKALDEVSRIKLITRTAPRVADNIDTGKQQQDITDAIKKLARLLFDLIPGLTLPPTGDTIWKYGPGQYTGGEKQHASVAFLTRDTATGGRGAKGYTDEMRYLYQNGEQWVRMHLITGAIGGQGGPENWVPAPNEVNTGDAVLYSFEQSAEEVVRTRMVPEKYGLRYRPKDVAKHLVLWVDVQVTNYHTTLGGGTAGTATKPLLGFAKHITFEHGLYLPPASGTGAWTKVDQPLSRQRIDIREPPHPPKVILGDASDKELLRTQNRELTNASYGAGLRAVIMRGAAYGSRAGLEAWLQAALPGTRSPELRKKLEEYTDFPLATTFARQVAVSLDTDVTAGHFTW
jgi:hypothetical protein